MLRPPGPISPRQETRPNAPETRELDSDEVPIFVELKVEDVGIVGCAGWPDQHTRPLPKVAVLFLE